MMGKSQRDKGARWERAVANLFREAGWDAQRTAPLQAGGAGSDVVATRLIGCGAQGCRGASDGERVFTVALECKVGARPPWIRALEQAERDATAGELPVAAIKVDRKPPVVVLRLADFLELVR